MGQWTHFQNENVIFLNEFIALVNGNGARNRQNCWKKWENDFRLLCVRLMWRGQSIKMVFWTTSFIKHNDFFLFWLSYFDIFPPFNGDTLIILPLTMRVYSVNFAWISCSCSSFDCSCVLALSFILFHLWIETLYRKLYWRWK